MLSNRESLAIAELVIYTPLLLITILVLVRQGHHKNLGWIYLFSFVATRITGAAVAIASAKQPTNDELDLWIGILDMAGLGPLLMAGLGLLKRMWVFDYLLAVAMLAEGKKLLEQGKVNLDGDADWLWTRIDQTSTHIQSEGRSKFMQVVVSHTIILRGLYVVTFPWEKASINWLEIQNQAIWEKINIKFSARSINRTHPNPRTDRTDPMHSRWDKY